MEKFTLGAELREKITKGEMKKLRKSGKIPAIFYGEDKKSIPLTVDSRQFKLLILEAGHNAILDLIFPDKTSKKVLVKDIQRNVVTRDIMHADFYQISMKKKIEVAIPVVLEGEAPGVKSGGVLDHTVRELKVKCLPTEIPDKIKVDVSRLEIGNSISVKDLIIPKELEVLIPPEQLVVNIVAPTILEEVVPGAPVEGEAEPEVIGKGKKEEEEVEEGGKPAEAKKESAPAKKEPAHGDAGGKEEKEKKK
ncbi:MAG: 50S ribosomal protein L25 [Elusimicrobia bacterium]|nr:50S ribosomal protein L25 [Elusimicrobiota bacterium]